MFDFACWHVRRLRLHESDKTVWQEGVASETPFDAGTDFRSPLEPMGRV